MNVFYIWSLIYFAINTVFGKITVNKVIVRVPRPNDIGLIFDLTVINAPCKEREALEFRIRSDGMCSVNVTECITMKNAGRVVGGNFGLLDAGAAEVVSLIWPTVSLYNRVGSCPIIVTAKNIRNIEEHQKHTIHFDTRFTTLDPEGHTLRKRPDYKDCKNWDKEYLKNCTPVNCEERYFGQRSFYNETTQHCDEVPACDKPNMIYNFYTNECFIPENFFTAEDLKKIQSGDFVDESAHEEEIAQAKTQARRRRVYTVYSKNRENIHAILAERHFGGPSGSKFSWRKTLSSLENNTKFFMKKVGAIIFLQVLATVAIYVLICFVIFLIVTWISRRQCKCNADTSCVLRSPTASDGGDEPLITPSSLLSQR
ncbi:uncharacterized protein LOC118736295 [Rhagoletis pomonella]|uniref:uncharacterized protein LOC118736295 n=1 Tax=Rhagoletis pomonella TaxID=28610 RepID=UPI00177B9FFE|nr:uncharacterized protein LOC118736295 [Rhagoletis pomonella]